MVFIVLFLVGSYAAACYWIWLEVAKRRRAQSGARSEMPIPPQNADSFRASIEERNEEPKSARAAERDDKASSGSTARPLRPTFDPGDPHHLAPSPLYTYAVDRLRRLNAEKRKTDPERRYATSWELPDLAEDYLLRDIERWMSAPPSPSSAGERGGGRAQDASSVEPQAAARSAAQPSGDGISGTALAGSDRESTDPERRARALLLLERACSPTDHHAPKHFVEARCRILEQVLPLDTSAGWMVLGLLLDSLPSMYGWKYENRLNEVVNCLLPYAKSHGDVLRRFAAELIRRESERSYWQTTQCIKVMLGLMVSLDGADGLQELSAAVKELRGSAPDLAESPPQP